MYTNNPEEFLGTVVSTKKVNCGGNCPEVESRQPENRNLRGNKDCCSPNGININFNVDSQNDISRRVENPPMVQPMVMNPNIIQPVFKTQDFTSDMDVNFPNGAVYTVKNRGTDIFPDKPVVIQKPVIDGPVEIPAVARATAPAKKRIKPRRVFYPQWQ